MTGIGWDRGRKGFLSELVGLDTIEDIPVELFVIDLVECFVTISMMWCVVLWEILVNDHEG